MHWVSQRGRRANIEYQTKVTAVIVWTQGRNGAYAPLPHNGSGVSDEPSSTRDFIQLPLQVKLKRLLDVDLTNSNEEARQQQ